MKLYPALKCHMGQWNYFSVKMRMEDLASEVKFASEIHNDKTLDDAIQRELSESRSKSEIAKFLSLRGDRFFSSIVVAAMGGQPKFYSVTISDDPRFELISDAGLDEAFGVLSFRTGGDDGVNYYALDGQHRLRAIKSVLDREDPGLPVPDDFKNEEVSVLIVVPGQEFQADFLKSYRRLFSSLNRHAKPTSPHTNIIMDEDDVFAILTRRLIGEYPFFQYNGDDNESPVVKTQGGENLRSNDSYFTSITTMYKMISVLLITPTRYQEHFSSTAEKKAFTQFRPDEETIDLWYNEIVLYWDCLLEVVPDLNIDPTLMRDHDVETAETQDHLLFWPIGQVLLARISRDLLDSRLPDPDTPDHKSVTTVLSPLNKIDWDLHSGLWRNFLLVPANKKPFWAMRNQDRNKVIDHAREVLRWIVGLDERNREEHEEMKDDWKYLLSPPLSEGEEDAVWEDLMNKQIEISTKFN